MTERDVENQAGPIIEQLLRAIPAVSDLRISYQNRIDNERPDILAEVEIEGPSKGSRTVPYALIFEVKVERTTSLGKNSSRPAYSLRPTGTC